MKDLSEVYQRIAPELMRIVEERYILLNHISYAQPIGRRMLATLSKLSERVVRSHVEIMKDNGLVGFTQQGMILTEEGKELLPQLNSSMHELNKISELEAKLKEILDIDEVIITNGGSETDMDRKELGFQAAKALQGILQNGSVLAVSGGSTMATMAEALPAKKCQATVIPARGGIGERVEYQANVIASVIADKIGSTYKMLHLPDGLSQEALNILMTMEPQIKEVIELSHQTDILMFGIGEALHMAEQRHITDAQRAVLRTKRAVGEALGYYCDIGGNIVYTTNNVGIALTDIVNIPHVIAVAGGAGKAKAIIGVMRACRKGTLIIDESAAEAMAALLRIS
ncbi:MULTISPECIES: sugar-binding domain-containing protein [unclassified Veillonella]|uniref:sugar-binding transcriptional regulator n=1 Tax=unclassified Veillonella TaxID=2630086 RepID=UPI0013894B28|nr:MULTISPECIES: sugar-binding domain-containing protein [unclassified Veillonella]KAF1682689.1 sugar-binding protein [Veillonella sp. R32]